MFQLADDDDDFPFQKAIKVRTITNLYTLLIIPEMWRQLVKYKEGFCLVLNRNKDSFTNWRHALGIIHKVYKSFVLIGLGWIHEGTGAELKY